ncbi:MAG TPA: AAA family ATPase [Acidobacteriota bacterium]|jgi:ABC-type Mn2+/Zn2+ transport system ATPase subunit|nr:AAA family ATPase [Acidobacteriota bacterium]HNR38248.1 AAA family ATPase [Acidobacteriota bacterium]HNU00745.1 AAA family ATPase [Acidobacteriota bacterium]HUN19427.1 AAA family ATPase [Caldisericia bacterium]
MRLTSLYIGQYKNLRDFSLSFDGGSFIDVFVGKNGTGKSNLFEALIEIFRHLVEFDRDKASCDFNYRIGFEIDGKATEIGWNSGKLSIGGKERKTIGKTPLPDNVLIYYSGHNDTVAKLVEQYEGAFRKRIKRADFDEARYFIGIGPDYKELLLAVLLMQPETCKARQFICQKLGIETVASEAKVVLERPAYAADSRFDIELNDETDRYWKPEGITKTFLDRLHGCINTATGSPVRSEGYFSSDDRYILYFDIAKIRQEFADLSPQELFRQFDNLKTLGMLAEITIPLQLTGGVDATIAHFSDGQFQSVYIYSIVELFKDRNCITLLDEPDSFLHPEWQFDFLKQVFEITDTTAKNNHVLMSSHSASTITNANESVINLFEFDGSNVVSKKVRKADVIKSLSAGLISFSESEARLNIHHVLKNTTGAVLFTEGITDEMILETAWSKLFPTEERNFEIQNAFSCGFLRNLIKDNTLYQNHPGRTFFSVFDFDEAYNDWNQLGQNVQTDPCQCLVKKHNAHESYAMLLPVPTNGQIRNQVINPHTGGNYGNRSLLTIELLFHGVPGLDQYFVVDTDRTDGFIKFVSDGQKVAFAKDVVPTLAPACFEVFRPMFEFIKTKCPAGAEGGD